MGYEAMIAKSDWILQKIAFKAVVNVVLILCFSQNAQSFKDLATAS